MKRLLVLLRSLAIAACVTGSLAAKSVPLLCSLDALPSGALPAGTTRTLTVTCSGGSGSPLSYAWAGYPCTGTTTATCTVAPDLDYKYLVTVNDGGLITTASLTIVVTPYCTLTAMPSVIFPGGTSVLTASCRGDVASFSWSSNTGFGPAVTSGSVAPSATTVYSVTGGNGAGNGNTALASVTVSTSPVADLFVSQSRGPIPAGVGWDLRYTLTVANLGSGPAAGVTLTGAVPAGATFVWASPACSNAAGTVVCAIGALSGGTVAQVSMVFRPISLGVLTNTATVSATPLESDYTNNASSITTQVNITPAGAPVARYRLYSPVTLEHHFTTDLNEYNILGGYVGTWVQEGTVGKILNNPGQFNGVDAVPYYRLYDTSTRWHHWTTDANEYYTLIQYPNWNAEGVDGWILPTNVAGTTQLYRLNYPHLGSLHHWTIDANEYTTLINQYGWVGEGGSGFVVQ